MSDPYDLIVIGAGMAGTTAARRVARAGRRVAIVDELPYGGTCALRGCDPKKILRRGAEVIDAARRMQGRGVDGVDGLSVAWKALMEHKRGFTKSVPTRLEGSLQDRGVDTWHGHARFTGPSTLRVGDVEHEFEHALVSTGAVPRPLDVPGEDLLLDSTDFLELEALPERLLFVGGGFVSFEFAHIAARAGASVTVIDRGRRPLKGFDPGLVDRLVAHSRDRVGIDVRTGTELVGVEPRDGGASVATLATDGDEWSLEVDAVVHGAGRVPALEGLGLDAADVAYGRGGVAVAPHLQSTSNARVWAAGDAADTAAPPLTPVAVTQGKAVATNLLDGTTRPPELDAVPTVVFTIPELARVGLLEDEARARGLDVDVRTLDTSRWFSNYRVAERTAAVKVIVDTERDVVVGAHLLGPEYAELVNVFAMAMQLGLTTRQLRSVTLAYPTVGSDLASML